MFEETERPLAALSLLRPVLARLTAEQSHLRASLVTGLVLLTALVLALTARTGARTLPPHATAQQATAR